MLTKEQLDMFQNKMLDRKVQIEKNLQDTRNELESMKNIELKDEADYAVASSEVAIDDAILEQQRKELNEIELALDKIRKGIFGVCEMCEEPIGIARLEVKNFARYCIVCREITEKE